MTTNKSPQASYIIPFRGSDQHRIQNLCTVLDWVSDFPNIEIIVVEQDDRSKLKDIRDKIDSYHFQKSKEQFNKSAALNKGVELARSEALILADADMIIAHAALELSITACREHADAVNPYTHLYDLSEPQRDSFLSNRTLPTNHELKISKRQMEGEQLCFCGGLFLIRKEIYHRVGGMDEDFQGWGGEDDAMSIKLEKFGISQMVKDGQTAYHLWHPRPQTERYAQKYYSNNTELLKFYTKASREELMRYIHIDK